MKLTTRTATALLAVFCAGGFVRAQQTNQTLPGSSAQAAGQGGEDPLAVGKSALQRKDFTAAREFFAAFLAANPNDVQAMFELASADLELKNFAEAIKYCQAVIAVRPNEWGAHNGLAFAYAQTGDWAAFDKERAFVKAARDRDAPGLSKDHPDVIDRLTVGDDSYTVFAFSNLYGKFHARYFFIHFTKDGTQDHWIACESDDVDQTFFAKAHPQEAAAGLRSFSLDSYARRENGGVHGTLKLYSDGEPTYETVRTDVLNALQSKTKPMSTTTIPNAAAQRK